MNKVYCSRCGKDISRHKMIIWHHDQPYCYDCSKFNREDELTDKDWIRNMYEFGYKPSLIARILKCDTKYVYEVLSNE